MSEPNHLKSLYRLEKDTTAIEVSFYDTGRILETTYDFEEPYYSYHQNDGSYIEVNKPQEREFKSYKEAWINIKQLFKEGYELNKRKSINPFKF